MTSNMSSTLPRALLIIPAIVLAACNRVDEFDERGRTPLMVAAARGDTARVRQLLAEGAYVNADVPSRKMEEIIVAVAGRPDLPKSDIGYTPLMYGVMSRNPAVVRMLIDAGADVRHATRVGHTPLALALERNSVPMVRLLTAAGARPDYVQVADAVAKRPAEMVALLLRRGGNPNGMARPDPQGGRPWSIPLVIAATLRGDPAVLSALLEAGANPNVRDPNGWTALRWARDRDTKLPKAAEVVALLEAAGARDEAGAKQDALFRAIAAKDVKGVRAALEAGANPNARDRRGATPLINASYNGLADIVSLLVSKRAFVDFAPTNFSATPLTAAIENGSVATVKVLLAAGANPNRNDGRGWTPMFAATIRGQSEMVRALLADSAKADDRTLGLATRRGDSATVKILLDLGIDPNRGMTGASYGCNAAVIRMLLERGAKARRDDYPLVARAAERCEPEALQQLLVHGGDPNELYFGGDPAMIRAARSGKVENVRILMRAGADLNRKAVDGRTAYVAAVAALRDPAMRKDIERLRDSISASKRRPMSTAARL